MKKLRPGFSRRDLGNRGAFTLVEIIVAMAVFMLLAACVFGIMTSILQSASSLQDNQKRRDQVAALNAFIRTQILRISARTVFLSYRSDAANGLVHSGILFDFEGMAVALDTQVQPDGYDSLRYTSYQSDGSAGFGFAGITDTSSQFQSPAMSLKSAILNNDSSLKWQPLIRDIRSMAWKFQDRNASPWIEEWNNNGSRPVLVQLSIQLAGDLQSATLVYWLPPLALIVPQTAAPVPGG